MAHATECIDTAHRSSWSVLLTALLGGSSRRTQRARLDVRSLPDHLKRDMGILDGNDPAGRHR
jgi:hypothetical protein